MIHSVCPKCRFYTEKSKYMQVAQKIKLFSGGSIKKCIKNILTEMVWVGIMVPVEQNVWIVTGNRQNQIL